MSALNPITKKPVRDNLNLKQPKKKKKIKIFTNIKKKNYGSNTAPTPEHTIIWHKIKKTPLNQTL